MDGLRVVYTCRTVSEDTGLECIADGVDKDLHIGTDLEDVVRARDGCDGNTKHTPESDGEESHLYLSELGR